MGLETKEVSKIINRTFSVLINDKKGIDKMDLLGPYGEYRAVKIKSEIIVKVGRTVNCQFKKKVGEPVLNAIEVYIKL